jgi:hypothetical protein
MRLVLAGIGFVAALALSWWVPVVCIVLLAIPYRAWEAILLGAFIDLLWLPAGIGLHSLPLFTIGAIVVVWGLEPLRAQFLVS